MNVKRILVLGASLLALSNFAFAAKADGAPQGAAPSCDGLIMATGPQGKGYDKLGQNLQKVGAKVCLLNSEGGLDNLGLLSTKKADVGIVPIDALQTMSKGDRNIASLQVVATLNSNYLHVATLSNGFTVKGAKKYGIFAGDDKTVMVTKFSQLRGVPVALVGSAQLLGRQLDKTLGFGMQITDVGSDKEAVEMLKRGQVYAVMSVASWPHGFFDKLKGDSGVTLIPFDVTVSGPYTVQPLNYKGMGVYNVNSLGVQNLLVARQFSGSRTQLVGDLKKTIAANLGDLKDGSDYEPAWNEIQTLDAKVDWPNIFQAHADTLPASTGKRK